MVKELSFKILEKKFSKQAEAFVADQETLVLFLNSSVRKNWFKILKLDANTIKKINTIVGYYAKLKINEENKKKPKTRKEIIKIEDACLKKVFQGRIITLKNVTRADALNVAKKILKKEYPKAVIFDMLLLEKLSVLTGVDGTRSRFTTDFLVFDPEKKKIIGIGLLTQ